MVHKIVTILCSQVRVPFWSPALRGKWRIVVFDETIVSLCLTALSQSLHPLGHLTVGLFGNTIKHTPCTSLSTVTLSE
jgi:hypothetical protein